MVTDILNNNIQEIMKVNGVDFNYQSFPIGFIEGIEKLGVSEEHIEKLKSRIMISEPSSDVYKYTETKSQKIPVDKIIGISLNDAEGKDVITTILEGVDNYRSFFRCLKYLNGRSLKDLYNDYENMPITNSDAVCADYYPDLDGYFVSNGRHRALMAILLGVPFINANVSAMKEDKQQKKWHLLVDKFMQKYNILDVGDYVVNKNGKIQPDYAIKLRIDNVEVTFLNYGKYIKKELKDEKLDNQMMLDKKRFQRIFIKHQWIRKIYIWMGLSGKFGDAVWEMENEKSRIDIINWGFNMYNMQ